MRSLLSVLFFIIVSFCFSQETNCKLLRDSIYSESFTKKPILSKKFTKIPKNEIDSTNFYLYSGIVGQFDFDNQLYAKSSIYIEPLNRCMISYAFRDWQTINYYNQNGELKKRTQTFYSKIFNNQNYFFESKNKLLITRNLGDVLFKMTAEDFVKILEQNNINPMTTKMRTSHKAGLNIEKHITPNGCFWEYQLMSKIDPFISILISDSDKKVIAKTYSITPEDAKHEKVGDYYDIRDSILFSINKNYKRDNDEIEKILSINKIDRSTYTIKKYALGTWLVQSDLEKDGNSKPVLLLIDDEYGRILINLNDYPKNIYGEEKFICDFNDILFARRNKNK